MKADQKDKRILVLMEKENGGVDSSTFELLRAGRELANNVRGNLCAAVIGHGVGDISQEIANFLWECPY